MKWKSFLIGLFVGVVLTLVAVWAIGSRYRVTSIGSGWTATGVKLDTWSGKSWRLDRGIWEEIKNQ